MLQTTLDYVYSRPIFLVILCDFCAVRDVACYFSVSCLVFVDVLCIICVFWFSQILCCFSLPLLFCTLIC